MNNHLNWIQSAVCIFFILNLGLYSCSDPTAIGTDLLEQDLIEVGFIDTLTIRSKTINPIRTLTYAPPFQLDFFTIETFNHPSTFLFGQFSDPIFGKPLLRSS